jgi:D-beta-D-heptose 7-phosphate kinase / D-beta-D-heptose 1-phosphate adenosyltransferase
MHEDSESALAFLVRIQQATVLVVGDVMLDRYIYGEVTRISPEAPVPVLRQEALTSSPGGAANVAACVAAAGARAILIGRIGCDPEADELHRALADLGVDSRLLRNAGVATSTKTRLIANAQQLARVDREEIVLIDEAERAELLKSVTSFLEGEGPRAIVLADYAKGLLSAELVRSIIDAARLSGVPVTSDPKGIDLSRYKGSTVLKPNRMEAAAGVGVGGDHAIDDEDLARRCLAASMARNIVMTCSEDGAVVVGEDIVGTVRLAGTARAVSDVSGAGDTFIALLAMGLASGETLETSVVVANAGAGLVCEKLGTATISASELLGVLVKDGNQNGKILHDRHEAEIVGAAFAAEGRRLVLANGCFDLLHAGHVKLLQQARQSGDALMVAINSDESVRRLKGNGRPLQNGDDRSQILSSLECVDFVVEFAEDTPLELIVAVRPSLLVKGDDYKLDDVVGRDEVRSWGGTVLLVPQLEGKSTSNIVRAGQFDSGKSEEVTAEPDGT